jgi:hypothetical protein
MVVSGEGAGGHREQLVCSPPGIDEEHHDDADDEEEEHVVEEALTDRDLAFAFPGNWG